MNIPGLDYIAELFEKLEQEECTHGVSMAENCKFCDAEIEEQGEK